MHIRDIFVLSHCLLRREFWRSHLYVLCSTFCRKAERNDNGEPHKATNLAKVNMSLAEENEAQDT